MNGSTSLGQAQQSIRTGNTRFSQKPFQKIANKSEKIDEIRQKIRKAME